MTAQLNNASTPLGIMGGAFDPVHFGHLRSALELQVALQLGELRFVPSANPPHRPPHFVSPELRVRMLEAAIDERPGWAIDKRELNREGPSWSFVTLQELRTEIPSRSICLLLGMDAFLGLPTWHRWEELVDLAHIVVASRPGSSLPQDGVLGALLAERATENPQDLHTQAAGKVFLQEVTQLEISSSLIRRHIENGMSARYLVPDRVLKIMADNGCYITDTASTREQGLHA